MGKAGSGAVPAPAAALAPRGAAGLAIRALTLAHFVAPLLFFTNLTHNPCFTQIALLYVLLSIVGLLWVAHALRTGIVRVPLIGFERGLALFLAFALLTSVASWVAHRSFRDSILFESLRMWIFTLVNGVWALYLPSLFIRPMNQESKSLSIWPDLGFACAWGLAWLAFPAMQSDGVPRPVLSPYAAILWTAGIAYVLFRTRGGDARSFFHVIFVVTVLAGGYALIQYAGIDPIWESDALLPGGRPVSTFGNPSFLSSYLLLACILAFALALSSKRSEAVGYGVVAVLAGLAIVSTQTRSTYAGLGVGLLALVGLTYRREHKPLLLRTGAAVVALIVLILVFPGTHGGANETPLDRLQDLLETLKAGEAYAPLHQRVLTWASAWDMVKASPVIGQGWGCFAIVFPFYQAAHLSDPLLSRWPARAGNAHNVVMELWAQVGTVGLCLALLLGAAFLVEGTRTVRRRAGTRMSLVAAGLLAALIGMLVDNLLNVSLFIPIPAFLFGWFAGSLCNERAPRAERAWPLRSPGAATCTLGVACLFLLTGYYYVARWRQEIAYLEGAGFARANRFEEAIRRLEAGHRWFPRDVNTNYELGNSYVRQGERLASAGLPEQARQHTLRGIWAYEEALKANPGYDTVHFNLGVTALKVGDESRGVNALRTAIAINPRLEVAYALLAERYVKREAWEEAQEVLGRAARMFPENREFRTSLSDVEKRRQVD